MIDYFDELVKHSREIRRAANISISLNNKLQVTHIRLRRYHKHGKSTKPIYDIRLSNKQEKSFNKWDHMIRYVKFPIEQEINLMQVCLENQGKWVEFVSEY